MRQFVAEAGRTPGAPSLGLAGNAVVIGSGKGGVGTSSVAALIGLQLARAGREILVVDANDGGLHLLFGMDARPGLDALRSRRHPAGVATGAGPGATHSPARWLGRLPRSAHPAAWSDRRSPVAPPRSTGLSISVLVDGGPRIASVLEACAVGADRFIAVTGADRLSAAATYALLKGVGARLPGLSLEVLVNRESTEAALRVDRHLRSALEHFHTGSVSFTGVIPPDAAVHGGPDRSGALLDVPYEAPAARAALEIGTRLHSELRPRTPDIRSDWFRHTGT